MALDEALLVRGDPRPTLRFYTWRPDALSLGYFQRWSAVPERERATAVVRRLTGGGAIHHADELTFSIAAALDHPLYRGTLPESYARVHGLVAEALAGLGVRAELRGTRALASERPGSAMCFHESTPLDLVWDARKGVGSAQRRSGGRVLHHGSIKIGASVLEGDVATLRPHAEDLTPEALAERLRESFERALGASFELEEPSADELAHARERAGFFTSEAFLRRR